MSHQPPLVESDFFDGLIVKHLKYFDILKRINFYRSTGKRLRLHSFSVAFYFSSLLPHIFFQFISLFVLKIDLQRVAITLMIFNPMLQTLCKIWSFWFYISEISTLFNLLKKDFLDSTLLHRQAHAKEVYRQTARNCNVFLFIAYAGIILIIPIWILMPGYDTEPPVPGVKKVLSGWYPFNNADSPGYEIVYVYESFVTITIGPLFPLYNSVFLLHLMGLYAQFVVLSHNAASLRKEGDVTGDDLHEELRLVLKDYNKLLSYSDKLKDVYTALVTVILVTGPVTLLVTVLQLLFENTGTRSQMSTWKCFIYMSYEAVQVTLICFCSSLLQTASAEVHFAIYSSDWYEADKKFAYTTQMMMARAMKPVTLTAMKMYPVNMETLQSISQFIYSTAAVLSNVNQ